MHTDESNFSDPLTEEIIACAYRVQNSLGCGFLEKVYENALATELRGWELQVHQQVPYDVRYRGDLVGHYVADLLVEECVLIEVKACSGLSKAHRSQALNYLKASGLPICLLLNFGLPRVEVQRLCCRFPTPALAR